MAGSCEHSIETSCSTKRRIFDQMKDYQFLKKDCCMNLVQTVESGVKTHILRPDRIYNRKYLPHSVKQFSL